jgi:hypothetical protein
MPFVISLGFATETDKNTFVEKIVPKVRGHQTDPPTVAEGEEDVLYRIGLTVTSQSAAKELCHHMVAFLAHNKKGRITADWTGVDGQPHTGTIEANAARDAEVLAMRLGAAAKAHMDTERVKG